jgi:prophage regulatory protein
VQSNSYSANPLRIVREKECAELTGLSRQRRWVLTRKGEFPNPVRLSDRASGWRYYDIEAWLRSRRPAALATSATLEVS